MKAIYWIKTTLLLVACFATCILPAQNMIGIPNIVNYSKQQYNAGSQNWGVVQDVPNLNSEPRDASATSIIASALLS